MHRYASMSTWMEWRLEARHTPYSTETVRELVPSVKPPFCREGNDIATSGLTKRVLRLGVFALSEWVAALSSVSRSRL